MTKSSLTMERRRIAELECTVVDSPGCTESIRGLVLLCHGFGAAGDDLVPCAGELYSSAARPLDGVRFVFPAAPIQMDPSGMHDARAWWPIDTMLQQQIMESGGVRDLRKEKPRLLLERRRQITDVIGLIQEEADLDASQTVIGGFSQGAMLTTDVALAFPKDLGGLIVWSGTLLNEKDWKRLASSKSELKVVQSHGQSDPVLPYQGAELLRSLFAVNQIKNNFIGFSGQHAIPQLGITAAAELIESILD